MKTWIINGSPRPHGDTAFLIRLLLDHLPGENTVLNAYDAIHTGKIRACTDCRFCWENPGCSIQDDMQQVYRDIQESDCIIIASPVYFSELTGPLLCVLSRLQTYYTARMFRGETPILKKKRSGVLLTGGGDGNPKRALETATGLLRQMNAQYVAHVISANTNHIPASKDANAIAGIKTLAQKLTGNDL